MKEEFDKAISTAIATKDVQLFGNTVRELSNKFGVSQKTIHNRFHSIFGQSFRDFVIDKIQPTKKELSAVILNTKNSEECRKQLNLSNRMYVGIFDRHFKVSTYSAAKEILLISEAPKIRKSSLREDNVSLLMSQYLGDGHYDAIRHSLRVCHGIKQTNYLKWKVGMIHEGYNKVSQEIKIRTHKQGHMYSDWYSGKLGNVDFPKELKDAVKLLTPLGWLLWYLDDGSYTQDISICINQESVAQEAKKELATYGIETRINKAGNANAYNVTMCGGANSIRFYKGFIEPFLDIIPDCMKYKTEVKI